MLNIALPPAAAPAELPGEVRPLIVSSCAELPGRGGWLHEVKHDGHRLVAIITGERLKLVSRNGYDRTELFREPFRGLAAAGLPDMVLDGEIAVPDERGVTHLDALTEAISERRPERLAYFAFDLLAPRRARPAALCNRGPQDAAAGHDRGGPVRADRLRRSCPRQRS